MALNLDFDQINKFLNSKGFETGAGLVGSFMKSKGENDRADRQLAMNNEQTRASLNQNNAQFAARMAAELDQARRGQHLSRAVAAANASPLGENEMFATKQRVLAAILPNLRNMNVTSPDARIAAATPKMPGFLPEGGLPPQVLAALSEGATANAIANRNRSVMNIDPRSPIANLEAMGFESGMGGDLAGYRQGLLDEESEADSSLDDTIQRALAQDYEGIMRLPGDPAPEKKKGFWGKLGGVLKAAAPIAAAFIPGIGPMASAALAAGGTVAGAKMQGEPWMQALTQGALSGAGSYGANRILGRGGNTPSPINVGHLSFDPRFPSPPLPRR